MTDRQPLWPGGIEIPILGVTGEHESGKSMFVVTIDPENTLAFDFQLSLLTYRFLGFKHVNVVDELFRQNPDGYSDLDAYLLMRRYSQQIPKDQYRVIAIDAITDIEGGLTDYVKSQYSKYGFKSADSFQKMEGSFWKAVREEQERFMFGLASKCECLAFTAHLRTKYVAGSATREKEPMGKRSLMKLATLYLWLDRRPNAAGVKPDEPVARVHKGRLVAHQKKDGGGFRMTKVLPDQFPNATPDQIRHFIANPPDWDNLPDEFRVKEEQMTEAERLAIQAQIAENQRYAAESQAEVAAAKAREQDARKIAMERMRAQAQTAPAEATTIFKQPEEDQEPTQTGNTTSTTGKKATEEAAQKRAELLWKAAEKLEIGKRVLDAAKGLLADRQLKVSDNEEPTRVFQELTEEELASFEARMAELQAKSEK